MFDRIFRFIRELYQEPKDFISLHSPVFLGNEKKYLSACIDSTFVSTVGPFVGKFESQIAQYTKSQFAVSTVNGTAALHTALLLSGVQPGDEVITQALTFVATANAISYCQSAPILIDVDPTNLGLDPVKLKKFLKENVLVKGEYCVNKNTGRRIAACVPVHIFGHPSRIFEIMNICEEFHIPVIEDAAEALGSTHKGIHMGTVAKIGVLSFNGNKVLTTGGGGMILTNDEVIAKRAKHLTTTARLSHSWDFQHDEVGYNYRMPNVNAALGCAQIEYLDQIISNKRVTAEAYSEFFDSENIPFLKEEINSRSNYWLNAIFLKDIKERDTFLAAAADQKIMARPTWALLNELPMFKKCQSSNLEISNDVRQRLVNIPSGFRMVK